MSALPASRLVLFPGMGVDGRMYDGLRRRIGAITVPPWLPTIPGENLNHYAQRYVALGLVRDGDVVGGSSFGGMLAQAIASYVRVKAVVLMGSCRTATALPALALALAPWARLVPARVCLSPAAIWALTFTFGIRHAKQRHLFIAMVSAIDPRQVRWACSAIANWRDTRPITCPIHQIHGKRDRIIPVAGSGAHTVIPGAGHVPALTHPAAIANWLRPILAALDHPESRNRA